MSHPSTAGGLRTLAAAVALTAVAGAAPLLAAGPAAARTGATEPAATPAAALPGAWAAPAKVTARTAVRDVRELVLTADGTAVALWTQRPSAAGADALYAAVRRPGAAAWGTPRQLGAAQIHEVRLVATGAGAAAVWTDAPGGGYTPTRLRSSALKGGRWSSPATLATAPAGRRLSGLGVAAAPDGTVTAAWGRGRAESYAAPEEVRAATRSATGTWSADVRVSRAPADEHNGVYGTVQAAVDRRGNTVLAYTQADSEESSRVYTVTRRPGSRAWSAPAKQFGSYSRAAATLTAGPTGTLALVWQDGSPDRTGHGPVSVATTADAAAGWPAVRTVPEPEGLAGLPARPQLDPAGTVTLVWTDGQGRLVTSALPRGAAARWSPVAALSTGPSVAGYDVSTGPDGTARVLWTERRAFPAQALVQAVRPAGGRWTVAPLKAAEGPGLDAEVVAGPGGRAVAVWSRQDTRDAGTLWSAGTAPVPAVTSATVPATADFTGPGTARWTPVWQLARPVSWWSLTLTDPAGRTVRTRTSAADTARIAPVWDGRTSAGALAPNGPLTWTLKVIPVGAASPVALASGTVAVSGGAAAPHDFGGPGGRPDGTGDVLVTTAAGDIRTVYGDRASGAFKGYATGSGWVPGTRPVAMGDLDGDRCDDVLVRTPDGELRRVTPGCGQPVAPASPYQPLGAGWKAYDLLTSAGDATGDGRPDLLARDPATGALDLYPATDGGLLGAKVPLGTAFKGYQKIVGAGDLTGDGHGDLLLQDEGGALWRMDGDGRGGFGKRVLLAEEWGAGYDVLAAAGDLTGDGRADLVARDAAGALWRLSGTGAGTLGAPVRIATGWGAYTGLY